MNRARASLTPETRFGIGVSWPGLMARKGSVAEDFPACQPKGGKQ